MSQDQENKNRFYTEDGSTTGVKSPTVHGPARAINLQILAALSNGGEDVAEVSGTSSPLAVVSPTNNGGGINQASSYAGYRVTVQSTSAGAPSKISFTANYTTVMGPAGDDTFQVYASSESVTKIWALPGRRIEGVFFYSPVVIQASRTFATTPVVTTTGAEDLDISWTGSNVSVAATVVTPHNGLIGEFLTAALGS